MGGALIARWASWMLSEPLFWLSGLRGGGRGRAVSEWTRILVVRLDEVGDVVLTSPMLRELRRCAPAAYIELVVKPQVWNLVERCPYVDRVRALDIGIPDGLRGLRWHAARLARHWRIWLFAWQVLRPLRFDAAIVPRWDADYSGAVWLAYASGARYRVGYSERVSAWKRRFNRGLDRWLTHRSRGGISGHDVERNLALLRTCWPDARIGPLELWLAPRDDDAAGQALAASTGARGPLIVFAIGAGEPSRCWAAERFVALGRWLEASFGAQLLLIGGPDDVPLSEAIQAGLGRSVINLVGRTTLRQAGALLGRATLVIGNDSGPAHLAAAAGAATIVLGTADPERFRPWGVWHRMLRPARCAGQEPCPHGASNHMADVTVEQAREAVEAFFAIPAQGAPAPSVSGARRPW